MQSKHRCEEDGGGQAMHALRLRDDDRKLLPRLQKRRQEVHAGHEERALAQTAEQQTPRGPGTPQQAAGPEGGDQQSVILQQLVGCDPLLQNMMPCSDVSPGTDTIIC